MEYNYSIPLSRNQLILNKYQLDKGRDYQSFQQNLYQHFVDPLFNCDVTLTDILFIMQESPTGMDSLRIKVNKASPNRQRTSKEFIIKQFKKLKQKFRIQQVTQGNQQYAKNQPVEIGDEVLKEKIETIKEKYRLKTNSEEKEDPTPQTIIMKIHQSPQTPLKILDQSPSNEKMSKILKSLQRFSKGKQKRELKEQKTLKARLNPTKIQGKMNKVMKGSGHKLSPSVRRYKNHSSFQQMLQNRSIAKKISSIKPSKQLNLGKLRKSYEEHQVHVHLRQNYLTVGDKKTRKMLFYG